MINGVEVTGNRAMRCRSSVGGPGEFEGSAEFSKGLRSRQDFCCRCRISLLLTPVPSEEHDGGGGSVYKLASWLVVCGVVVLKM